MCCDAQKWNKVTEVRLSNYDVGLCRILRDLFQVADTHLSEHGTRGGGHYVVLTSIQRHRVCLILTVSAVHSALLKDVPSRGAAVDLMRSIGEREEMARIRWHLIPCVASPPHE